MVETERWQRLSKIGIIELRTDRILGWVERKYRGDGWWVGDIKQLSD